MPRFLVQKLDGPMQAWGTHTYEDFRPSNLFPTRSGLLGLLGACRVSIGATAKSRPRWRRAWVYGAYGSNGIASRRDDSGRTRLASDFHTA